MRTKCTRSFDEPCLRAQEKVCCVFASLIGLTNILLSRRRARMMSGGIISLAIGNPSHIGRAAVCEHLASHFGVLEGPLGFNEGKDVLDHVLQAQIQGCRRKTLGFVLLNRRRKISLKPSTRNIYEHARLIPFGDPPAPTFFSPVSLRPMWGCSRARPWVLSRHLGCLRLVG